MYKIATSVQSSNQSKVLTKPHAGKGKEKPHPSLSQQHHRGQQTLRHEVTQAWGAMNESQQHLACATSINAEAS